MSKAFTKESDDAPEVSVRRPIAPSPGGRNCLTLDGAQRFREELKRLTEVDRPPLTARAEGPPAADHEQRQRELARVDERILQIKLCLRSAVVLHPPPDSEDRVRFGAWVRVRPAAGMETTYRLVGTDEIDLEQDWVSWISPIAKALLNARCGDRVRLQLPSGTEELEVLSISYTVPPGSF